MRILVLALSALAALSTTSVVSAAGGSPVPLQKFFIPLPESELLKDIFTPISSKTRSPIHTLISLAVSTDNTVIWYDHHEDGYEGNVTNPTKATTQIWGDGDASNGCAPIDGRSSCTNASDKLKAGNVIILENKVYVDSRRHRHDIVFDGGDLVQASLPIAITRAAFPNRPGSLMAGAVEVIEQDNWGTHFEAPVGQDTYSSTSAYELTALAIMAGEDGTIIKKNGGAEVTLMEGEAKLFYVNQGDQITSNKKIQADLITGDKRSNYQLRWYSLAPTEQWSTEAYAAVGDSHGDARVTVYNPGPATITVDYLTGTGKSDTLIIKGGESDVSPVLEDNDAAKFTSTGKFFAFSATDTTGGGQIFDWGYPLMTKEMVTPEVLIGMGFGCTGNDCGGQKARSVVWVTPVEDAEIWIDYDNDGQFDDHFLSKALVGNVIQDKTDKDMSGAVIWATKEGTNEKGAGVNIAAAWGQKASLSYSGDSKGMDLGTAVLPFDSLRLTCKIILKIDKDKDNAVSPGDTVVLEIKVINAGQKPIGAGDSLKLNVLGTLVDIDDIQKRGDSKEFSVTHIVPNGGLRGDECDSYEFIKPTDAPTTIPSGTPTLAPTGSTSAPTISPSGTPTRSPTQEPTDGPTDSPTGTPTSNPTREPTPGPTNPPTGTPTGAPTKEPTPAPTDSPTGTPTLAPTGSTPGPTVSPTEAPTGAPTKVPTSGPTDSPTGTPTLAPSGSTHAPTLSPTEAPTGVPTKVPTPAPSGSTHAPSGSPTAPSPTTRTLTPAPTTPKPTRPPTPKTEGDPHFTMFNGDKFDFHGECDMVFLKNPGYNHGQGMRIHIRTKKLRWWSYVQSAVVQIGDDTLEVMGGGDNGGSVYWFNGKQGPKMIVSKVQPFQLGGHSVRYRVLNEHTYQYKIFLEDGQTIILRSVKDFMKIELVQHTRASFGSSQGILGSYGEGVKLARNGTTILEDPNAFGQEWQVRDTEEMLFHDVQAPQFPTVCAMPATTQRRRLGEQTISKAMAASACKHAEVSSKTDCMFDVMATEDVTMAEQY